MKRILLALGVSLVVLSALALAQPTVPNCGTPNAPCTVRTLSVRGDAGVAGTFSAATIDAGTIYAFTLRITDYDGGANIVVPTGGSICLDVSCGKAAGGVGDDVQVTTSGTGSLEVNSLEVPVIHGASTAAQACTYGVSTDGADVTFGTAFGAAPACACSYSENGADPATDMLVCLATTTALDIDIEGGGAPGFDVQYICCGNK